MRRRSPPAASFVVVAAMACISLARLPASSSAFSCRRGVVALRRRPPPSSKSFRPPPTTASPEEEARAFGGPPVRRIGRRPSSPSPPFAAASPSSEDDDSKKKPNNDRKKYRPGSMDAAIAEQGRVPYGESSRKYRRTVFTHENWIEHRSGDRLTSNLRGIFFSGIVRQLQREVAAVTTIAVAVVLWNDVVVPAQAGGGGGALLPHLSLPSLPFTLSSPALGLLLVFRTNASYGRWTEARVAWGKIVSQCRNVVRMAETFASEEGTIDDPSRERAMDDLVRAAWLFPRTLMNALSGPEDDGPYEKELRETFFDDFALVDDVLSAPDRPTVALMELSTTLDSIPIDEKRRVEIDKSIVILGDLQSTCERIFASPVPLVYTRHTARFLSIWMLTLPLALYDVFAYNGPPPAGTETADTAAAWFSLLQGFAMAPAVGLLSLFLFGIEELAIQLEEPFSILPLQRFCDNVKGSTEGMRRWNGRRGRRRSTSEGSP